MFFGAPDTAYLPFTKGGLVKVIKKISDIPSGLRKLAISKEVMETQGFNVPHQLSKKLDLTAYDYYYSLHRGELGASPKPITGYKWKGIVEQEYVLKPGTKLYPTSNVRTQLYAKFGIKKGTSYNINPLTGETIEIMTFVTKRPPVSPAPKVIVDLPKIKQRIGDFTGLTKLGLTESGQLFSSTKVIKGKPPAKSMTPKKPRGMYFDDEGAF